MSYKDRLKQNQGGSEIPKMDVSLRLTAKVKDNKPGFVYMKDKEEKFGNFNITGVLLGSGMVLSAFSKDLGPKGGSFHSTVYFRKTDTITLFGPTNSGYKKEMSGNLDKVEEYLTVKRRSISSLDKTKKSAVLYVLTEKGLVEIRTNLTLGFDQMRSVQKQSSEMLVNITAAVYSDKNTDVSANAKKILGVLAEKNPPCYCRITATDKEITDDIAAKWNLEKHLDDFEKFKMFSSSSVPEEAVAHHEASDTSSAAPEPSNDDPLDGVSGEPGDDLPF